MDIIMILAGSFWLSLSKRRLYRFFAAAARCGFFFFFDRKLLWDGIKIPEGGDISTIYFLIPGVSKLYFF